MMKGLTKLLHGALIAFRRLWRNTQDDQGIKNITQIYLTVRQRSCTLPNHDDEKTDDFSEYKKCLAFEEKGPLPPAPTDLSLQQIPLSGQGVHNIARNMIKRPKCLGTYSEHRWSKLNIVMREFMN